MNCFLVKNKILNKINNNNKCFDFIYYELL